MRSSNSTERWLALPMPDDGYVSCPGFAFMSRSRSAVDRAGSAGCASTANGDAMTCVTGTRSRSVSYGSLATTLGFTAMVLVTSSSVWPSGGLLTTSSVPMIVEPPARLSITICCPSASVMRGEIVRIVVSVGPPAG
jgi:hypothetical protein